MYMLSLGICIFLLIVKVTLGRNFNVYIVARYMYMYISPYGLNDHREKY